MGVPWRVKLYDKCGREVPVLGGAWGPCAPLSQRRERAVIKEMAKTGYKGPGCLQYRMMSLSKMDLLE